jgi:hypothetical protein
MKGSGCVPLFVIGVMSFGRTIGPFQESGLVSDVLDV